MELELLHNIITNIIKDQSEVELKTDDIILFQGDSITDGGRKKSILEPNNILGLGNGFVNQVAAHLLLNQSSENLKIYNRGVNGNKVHQLAERWDEDCFLLKPSVLSILIGVNDYWHRHIGRYEGSVKIYEKDFRLLLKRTKDTLPDVHLIIGEPFAISGVGEVDKTWFPEFYAYQEVSRLMAQEFDAVFIPFQKIFDAAVKASSPDYWTYDGVHPTLEGIKLLAETWLKLIKQNKK